jgi:hypothetical protein
MSNLRPLALSAFESSLLDSEAWLRQADQFVAAAEVLVAEFDQPRRPRSEAEMSKNIGCIRAALLLLAIAVENSLKAVKVAQGQVQVVSGKVVRKSLGGGSNGHDLRLLAQEAGVSLSGPEELLLVRLSSIASWAGKYQQPLSEAEYSEASRNNPRSITPKVNVATVKGVLANAALRARAARQGA